jgi:hypothetical protein
MRASGKRPVKKSAKATAAEKWLPQGTSVKKKKKGTPGNNLDSSSDAESGDIVGEGPDEEKVEIEYV